MVLLQKLRKEKNHFYLMTINITRDNISDFINQEFGLSKKDCSELVNNIIEEIIAGLIKPKKGEWIIKNNNKVIKKFDTEKEANNYRDEHKLDLDYTINLKRYVKIHNFGTFKIRNKKSRKARNPKTKVEVMIPPRNVINFIPSKFILKKINKYINEQ